MVGKKFPFSFNIPLGNRFEIHDGIPSLYLTYKNPTKMEIYGFNRSKIRLGLVDGGNFTLFLTAEIPIAIDGWSDMPFSYCLLNPKDRPNGREIGDKQGYTFVAYLIDHNMVIRGIRVFTVSPSFSDALDGQFRKQLSNQHSFTTLKHHAEVEKAYKLYPTSAALAKAATIIEVAGAPF